MRFAPPPAPRPARENIVPMINVVFLLLIFFLMTAQIAPPEPFEVTPPASTAEAPAEGRAVLHVSASGELAYAGATGDAVFERLETAPPEEPLMLRADTGFDAGDLAGLMARLHAAGIARVDLVTRRAE